MAKDLPKEVSNGIGDISSIFSRQSVSDLRWLDVDPDEYKKFEALPKQNLDIIPELVEYLKNDDDGIPHLIPQRPITVVNSNPLDIHDTPSRASTDGLIKQKVASYVIAGIKPNEIKNKLFSEFSLEQLRAASSDIKNVLEERGLLGNVYIDSSHYPKCFNPKDQSHNFVSRNASSAQFVVAKDKCTNCVRNNCGICLSFNKRIVSSVPYDHKTLGHHINSLIAQNRINGSEFESFPRTASNIKDVLRNAYRKTPVATRLEVPRTIHSQKKEVKPVITDSDIQKFNDRQSKLANKEPLPSPHIIKAMQSMTYGKHNIAGLRTSSDPDFRKLSKEHGIIGHTYIDIDVLGGPKQALNFIKTSGITPDFLISRVSYEPSDELTQINKYEVHSFRPELGYKNFMSALKRAVCEKRISPSIANESIAKVKTASNVDWDSIISQINLVKINNQRVIDSSAQKLSFFSGDTSSDNRFVAEMDSEEVRRTISHLMNTGLFGKNLQKSILSRYTKDDLSQVPEVGHKLASEDGVQGFYYIDPTAYIDYGKGCSQGSRTLKHSSVKNVMACSKCTGCTLQTAPGWCSKYAKSLIRSVPRIVRKEASNKFKLPVLNNAPIENPVEKYELESSLSFDVETPKSNSINIEFKKGSAFD